MSTDVRVQLFGAVAAWRGADPVQLGATQQRAVFALLALAGGRQLTRDELARALWGDDPPRHAANVIQTHVKHLRHALDPGRAARAPSEVLARAGDGYLLRVNAEQVDALRFRRLAAAARAAHRSGAHDEVFRLAEESLRLWQARPVADLPLLADHPLVAALAEEHWAVVSWFADAALRLHRPGDALTAVEEAAAARPLDEPVHGWLIRLCVALGRRADALGCYERLRRRLAEELGVDPAPELRDLHRAVLREDPALDGTAPVAAPAPVPANGSAPADGRGPAGSTGQRTHALPRDLVDFTGRTDLLSELLAAIPAAGKPGTAPVIHAIDGMPGVGKTTLAVHLAHLVADRYPDGQLYVDLHGHSEQAPLRPAAAVDALLRQIGVPGDRIPDEFDQRVAMWRGELAGRRTLLLLDNAATADQIAALLPAEPGCLTLVTSRRRLAGLDGARPVSLGVLTAEEAVILQQRIVGSRVDSAPEAAQDVARHCGHLALAIRLAAARLAHRPGWSVSDLAARLGRAETPLRELALPGRTVEAAFALSYQDLSEPARRMFRLLGVHTGPDIDVRAAAAVADFAVDEADEVLAELVDAHLVEEPAAGRYRLHDLIRGYAGNLAANEPERDAAIDRLLTYYLHAALACEKWFNSFLARLHAELGERPPQVVSPPDRSAAAEWFAAERANLTNSVRFAARAGRDRLAWRLAYAVWRYLFMMGYVDDCLSLNDLALVAADRAGEPHGVAVAHNNTAGVHYKRGRWDRALWHVDQAIAIRAELDEPLLLVTSLGNKAGLLQSMGDLPRALAAAEQAHEMYEASGPHEQPSGIQLAIGQIACWMGDYAGAERHYLAMLDVHEANPKDNFRSTLLSQLGELRVVRGRFAEAIELISEASSDWPLYMPMQFGLAISWLGAAYCAVGQVDEALRHLRAAVAIMVEHGEVLGECEVRTPYGTGLLASGDVSGAIEQYGLALEIGERLGFPTGQAHALDGMADAYAHIDPARSARLRAQAEAIYRRLHMVRPVSVLAASLASQADAAAQSPA